MLKLHLCVACGSGFDVMDQEVVVWLNSSSGWLSVEKTAQACVCECVCARECILRARVHARICLRA